MKRFRILEKTFNLRFCSLRTHRTAVTPSVAAQKRSSQMTNGDTDPCYDLRYWGIWLTAEAQRDWAYVKVATVIEWIRHQRCRPVYSSLAFPAQVGDVLEHFLVAISRRRVAGQRAVVRLESKPLLLHQPLFTLLCHRELGGNHHQAEIDHKKRANLLRK